MLNKGERSQREKAMRLNKSIKLNGIPKDAKAFVRDFMKKHNIKESEVYGKKPKSLNDLGCSDQLEYLGISARNNIYSQLSFSNLDP